MDFDKTGRYAGEIVNCRKDGIGRYIFPGDVYIYEGPWVDGEKHGKNAKFSLPGYSEFEGDFVHGEINGRGKKVWADGRSYEGDWKDGEMHGKGVWRSSDGKETYEGEFANNKREGNGNLSLRNGDRYNGQFYQHKFHGRGSYLRENVVFVESNFQHGLLSGKCKIQFHKIATYIGECQENKLSGEGYFRCLDGSYESKTKFAENIPLYGVSGFELKIDRSSCVEEVIDPKGKDKKKENKKKPAGKKGSSVMEVEALVSLAAGDVIGALEILLMYSGEFEKSSLNLPYPDEIRRSLSLTLREYTPPSTTDHPDTGLGDVIPIWRRNPTLEECATAWERFPSRSVRYINGVNPLNGDLITRQGASEFSSANDPTNALISTQLSSLTSSSLRVTLPSTPLPSPNTSLSVVLDFKITLPSAETLSNFRALSINSTDYFSLTLLTWGFLDDQKQSYSLSLLIPSLSTTETLLTGCLWELSSLEDSAVVLSRWSDNQSFDLNNWHSVGLTISLSDDESSSGGKRSNSYLVVDGAGRMKIDKGAEGSLNELLGEFISDSSKERVWQVGGEGHSSFDGLVKNFIICLESDRCNLEEITSCFMAWASVSAAPSNSTAVTTNDETDLSAIPPNHSLIHSLPVMSCAGRAVVPPCLVLPPTISPGFYVIEISDATDERCRQLTHEATAAGTAGGVGGGGGYEGMCQVIPSCRSSKSQFKISVN